MTSGASGTQRAEQVPTYDPGGSGTIFWLGFNFTAPVFGVNSASWGPIAFQLRRNTLGNGPASINLHSGRIVIEGASTTGASAGSVLDMGALPSPGLTTRVVMGFYLHPTAGWIEAWRDGALVKRVSPWVSKDTSSDGVGTVGSTLPSGGDGVSLKLGAYRGGSGSPALDLRYSDMRASSTRAGVM
jgi:hypothetical protein